MKWQSGVRKTQPIVIGKLGSWDLIPVRSYNCGCGKGIICRCVLGNLRL